MARITVSLPETLAEAVERIIKDKVSYRKKSHLVADAVEEFLRVHYPEFVGLERKEVYPSILWKLKLRKRMRAPSPRLVGRKVAGEWVVVE